MIEVFQQTDGLFYWVLISEIGTLQVIGDYHPSDIQAHHSARTYRNTFREVSNLIDCYKHYIF